MIYLITGVPGSGKSLYAVSTLLKKLLSEKVVHEDGTTIERRLCIDGIPDLLLPHELLAKRPEGELRKVPNGPVVDAPAGEGNGLSGANRVTSSLLTKCSGTGGLGAWA
jgi:hypothetical protein